MSKQGEFDKKVINLARSNGGKIPLTHESPLNEARGIMKDGLIEGDSVFCSLGHITKKSFVTGPGVIIHIDLPLNSASQIYPDMSFTGEDEEESYGNLLKKHPDLIGAFVSVSCMRDGGIPNKFWKDVYDNQSGKKIWP